VLNISSRDLQPRGASVCFLQQKPPQSFKKSLLRGRKSYKRGPLFYHANLWSSRVKIFVDFYMKNFITWKQKPFGQASTVA